MLAVLLQYKYGSSRKLPSSSLLAAFITITSCCQSNRYMPQTVLATIPHKRLHKIFNYLDGKMPKFCIEFNQFLWLFCSKILYFIASIFFCYFLLLNAKCHVSIMKVFNVRYIDCGYKKGSELDEIKATYSSLVLVFSAAVVLHSNHHMHLHSLSSHLIVSLSNSVFDRH